MPIIKIEKTGVPGLEHSDDNALASVSVEAETLSDANVRSILAEDKLARVTTCLLGLGTDFDLNIGWLTALCGELLGATSAFYTRLEGDMLFTAGQWHAPNGYVPQYKAEGCICYDVIRQASDEATLIHNLDRTAYAITDSHVTQYGLRTYLGHVVYCDGWPIGSLSVVFHYDAELRDEDIHFLSILTSAFSSEENRRKVKEDLRQKEHILSESQRLGHVGSWFQRMGDLMTWSNESYRIYGVSPDEFFPSEESVLNLIHPDDRQVFRSWLLACAAGERPAEVEYRVIMPDGAIRFLMGRGELFCDVDNRQTHMAGTVQDITEHKQAEEERRKLEMQLLQSQKMEAVGQLAGGIAHDFNNLLQVILGNVEAIQNDLGLNCRDDGTIDEIGQAAKSAADLTRKLLAFSRRQVMQPANLQLNSLTADILTIIQRIIGEHIRLSFIPGELLGTVHVDKGQMEQVLMNLCVNARDAMPTGGDLTIETQNAELDDVFHQEHPWAKNGRYALTTVTDTGYGMDETIRMQIFEPFFTTKDVGKGTGLGLATVYGIIKQHNGLIHVYSEPDKGTVFKIYLPIVENATLSPERKVERQAIGGSETILLAEDEVVVRKLISRMLETAGYKVILASDGEEAIHVFDEHASEIDMVILDVMMPKLGGRETMDYIQSHSPRMRFLFSSGYSQAAIHTNFVIEEGLHLITKPYRRADLLHTIREILDD